MYCFFIQENMFLFVKKIFKMTFFSLFSCFVLLCLKGKATAACDDVERFASLEGTLPGNEKQSTSSRIQQFFLPLETKEPPFFVMRYLQNRADENAEMDSQEQHQVCVYGVWIKGAKKLLYVNLIGDGFMIKLSNLIFFPDERPRI